MTEVNNPALLALCPAETLDHFGNNLGDGLVRAVQYAGVGIALKNHWSVSNDLDSLRRIMEPIHANHLVSHIGACVEGVPCTLGEHHHGNLLETELLEAQRKVLGDISEVWLRELLEG